MPLAASVNAQPAVSIDLATLVPRSSDDTNEDSAPTGRKTRRSRNPPASRVPAASGGGSTVLAGASLGGSCSNCQTTVTPLWRRGSQNELLCNACGLYHKQHKKHRPRAITGAVPKPAAPSSAVITGQLGKGVDQIVPDEDVKVECANCEIGHTTMWRRLDFQVYCNQCYLWYKLHNVHRPLDDDEPPPKRLRRESDAGPSTRQTRNNAGPQSAPLVPTSPSWPSSSSGFVTQKDPYARHRKPQTEQPTSSLEAVVAQMSEPARPPQLPTLDSMRSNGPLYPIPMPSTSMRPGPSYLPPLPRSNGMSSALQSLQTEYPPSYASFNYSYPPQGFDPSAFQPPRQMPQQPQHQPPAPTRSPWPTQPAPPMPVHYRPTPHDFPRPPSASGMNGAHADAVDSLFALSGCQR